MTATKSSLSSPPSNSKNVFRIHGVNVLNRKNVDSIARLTALERRRATHILDERQRRDTMNQLLTELANLVRESATDLISLDSSSLSTTEEASAISAEATLSTEETSQQQSSPPPASATATTPTATTITTTAAAPSLNPDGTERRPPVKSNSITTLRSAIAEIHRLRTYAGLQTIIAAQSTDATSSSRSSTSSPSRSSSPPSDLCSLSTLAALACQQGGARSHETSPQPTKARRKSNPKSTKNNKNNKREASSMDEEEEGDLSMRMADARGSSSSTHNQLYSPPLSPSSPTVSHPHRLSPTSFAMPPIHQQYYHHHFQYHHQQQQYQQVIALTPPSTTTTTTVLPPLYSMVSPMDSESSSSGTAAASTGYHFGGAAQSNHF
ncbi:MAG: hypothetical protein JOS17DRAFT_792248 [Linnemannia elongata]|nr:MAG: hypothetical protein JOS17DRAFT_792248 [Linnemannia elongata]